MSKSPAKTSGLPRRLRALRRDLHARSSLLGMKVATTFYRRMVVMTYPLQPEPRSVTARVDVCIEELPHDAVDEYCAFRPEQSLREIRRRLDRGDRCFVSRIDGRIVDAGWIGCGTVWAPYIHRWLELDPGSVYNYDSYSAPEVRGLGLYMARNGYVARLNHLEGYRRSVALVAVENMAPKMVLKRAGLTPIGRYHCVRTGPWQRVWPEPWGDEPLPPLRTAAGPHP